MCCRVPVVVNTESVWLCVGCVCVISVAGVTGRHGRYRQEEERQSTAPGWWGEVRVRVD